MQTFLDITKSEVTADIDLVDEATAHQALTHPYLQDLSSGSLPDMGWAIADFARQYRGYSARFPQYLTAVMSRLDDDRHRAILLENLTEESGTYERETIEELTNLGLNRAWYDGIPHPQLFDRFCVAVGVDPTAIADLESVQSACWRELFHNLLLTGTPAEAVGALSYGTEAVVAVLYRQILNGCSYVPELTARDTVFFALHSEVDDGHQAAFASIAADLGATAHGRQELRKGMYKALGLRSAFWSHMHHRACEQRGQR